MPRLSAMRLTLGGIAAGAAFLPLFSLSCLSAGPIRDRIEQRREERREKAKGAEGLESGVLTHEGRDRTWHLRRPPGFDPAKARYPLIVALHGGGGTGEGMDGTMTGGRLGATATGEGFLVCFPDGHDRHWNDGRPLADSWETFRLKIDDVGFLTALIGRLIAEEGADPKRVHLVGFSNGGVMAYRMALDRTDLFASVAVLMADLPEGLKDKAPARPMPLLVMTGTEDPLMHGRGGDAAFGGKDLGRFLSTGDTVALWRRHNKAAPPAEPEKLPDADPKDGCRVERSVHAAAPGGAPLVHYRIVGGGHAWPGGEQYWPARLVGRVCRDIDASRLVVDFFKQHRQD